MDTKRLEQELTTLDAELAAIAARFKSLKKMRRELLAAIEEAKRLQGVA